MKGEKMDCCGSKKGDKKNDETNNAEQEHLHGGCCGGMWQHLILMVLLFAVIWFIKSQ